MTGLWDELEGVCLAGEYGLRRYLGSERNAAFFETTFGPDQQRAALELVPESAGGEEQLARWRKTFELSHPRLLPILDCGPAEAGGENYAYAVYEFPEDTLAGAADPLTPEQTRDVLAAVLDALRYLHQQGMAHTSVDAQHIVAVGDSIKLSSDTVRSSAEYGASPAEDVRAVGALLFELLTGRKPEPGRIPDLTPISEPLRSIIRHTVEPDAERRWTVDQIEAALNGRAPAVEPAPAPLMSRDREGAVPPAADEPRRSERRRLSDTDTAEMPGFLTKRSPALPLLLAAVGAVVVAIALAVTQHGGPEAASPDPAPVRTATAPASHTTPSAPAAATAPVSTAPVAAPVPARTPQPPARPRETWRVVAYTFNRYSAAEHKAQTINRKVPGFHATVFAPRGSERGPFFVSLGGRMSREEAVAVQRRARARGLPRDTFARNFSN